jgi:hypothetical protein
MRFSRKPSFKTKKNTPATLISICTRLIFAQMALCCNNLPSFSISASYFHENGTYHEVHLTLIVFLMLRMQWNCNGGCSSGTTLFTAQLAATLL